MNKILFLLFVEILKRDLDEKKAEKFLYKVLQKKIKKDKLKQKLHDDYQEYQDKAWRL